MIKFYTDGSCKGNGTDNARGAYGFIKVVDDKEVYSSVNTENSTTNNRMELKAVIAAARHAVLSGEIATIYTDSAYIHNCIKQKWYIGWMKNGWKNSKKEPVKNQDLWKQLIPYFESKTISFEKVKGHSTDKFNNIIDGYVQHAAADTNVLFTFTVEEDE